MSTHSHSLEAKKVEALPKAGNGKIGVCLTCHDWQVEGARPATLTGQLALCVQPQLQEHALVVSGSSGCNKWKKNPDAGVEAEAYAEQGTGSS